MYKQICKNQNKIKLNGSRHIMKKQSGKILKKNNKNINFIQNQQIKSQNYISSQLYSQINNNQQKINKQITIKQNNNKVQHNHMIIKRQQSLQNILRNSKLKKVKSQEHFPQKYRNLIEAYQKQHKMSKDQLKYKQEFIQSRITYQKNKQISQLKLKSAKFSQPYLNKIKQPLQRSQDLILRQKLKQIQIKYHQLQKSYKKILIQTKNQLTKFQHQKHKLTQLKNQHFNDQNQLDKLREQYFNKNKHNSTNQTTDLNTKDSLDNLNTKSIQIQIQFNSINQKQTQNQFKQKKKQEQKNISKQLQQSKIHEKYKIKQKQIQPYQKSLNQSKLSLKISQINNQEFFFKKEKITQKQSRKIKQQIIQKHQSQMNWYDYIKKEAGKQFIQKNYLQKIQTKSNFSVKNIQTNDKIKKIENIQKQILQSRLSSNKKIKKDDQHDFSYFKPKSNSKDLNSSQLRKSRKRSQEDISQLKKDLFNAKNSKEYLNQLKKSQIKPQFQQLKSKQYEIPKHLSPTFSKYRFKPSINIQ